MKPLKPGYSSEAEQMKLVNEICGYFGRVYDDAEEEKSRQLLGHHRGDEVWERITGGLPTMNETAKHFSITPNKVRKLLVTGGYYQTKLGKAILKWHRKGLNPEEIGKKLGMKPGTVRNYLPYERVIYNLEQRSVTADRLQRFKQRHGGYRKDDR